MPFLYPALLWGLGLIALPVLIHLINMMRQRRVRWAAMEFLLISQKRTRTWVLLKQLLLLLMRMGAVAAVVLMLAQPILRDQWSALFGGSKTHHLVLLDDSFSMSDRWGTTSAFERAKQVVERIGQQAAAQSTTQTFELLRFSRIGRGGKTTEWDLAKQPVDSRFSSLLTDTVAGIAPSQLATGPADVLEAVVDLAAPIEGENRVVYLVSDFRAREWNQPATIRKSLEKLEASGAQLQLVQCVDEARPNLAVTSLTPVTNTRAVGVPVMLEVSIKNFGDTVARNVAITIEEDGVARPAIIIEELPPGQIAAKRFQVNFLTAGVHRLAATLEADAITIDNARYCTIDLPLAVPVLLIDGDAQAARSKLSDSRFLTAALAPEGPTPTGLKTRIEGPRFLAEQPLDEFPVIYLANIARLDPPEVAAIEQFIKRGGGVAFFLGEESRADFFNSTLYRNGEGPFPVPLVAPTELLVDRVEKAPDLQITEHPIFSIFSAKRNVLIKTINIERYFAVTRGWAPPADSGVKVLARLRNQAPLVIEKPFGEGRVVAFLTTAGPRWNNWGRNNPTYVVAMQMLQSYLAQGQQRDPRREVGEALNLALEPAVYMREVNFSGPQTIAGSSSSTAAATASSPPATSATTPGAADGESQIVTAVASKEGGPLQASLEVTAQAGVYEARLTKTDGQTETRAFAVNVDPAEGDLHTLDSIALSEHLEGLTYQFHRADELNYDSREMAGFNLGRALLYVLVGLLLAEQLLAYFVSYHPPIRREARA